MSNRRVWPWDDDGTHPADCLLTNDRLPSIPVRNARPPQETPAPDAVPVLMPSDLYPPWSGLGLDEIEDDSDRENTTI